MKVVHGDSCLHARGLMFETRVHVFAAQTSDIPACVTSNVVADRDQQQTTRFASVTLFTILRIVVAFLSSQQQTKLHFNMKQSRQLLLISDTKRCSDGGFPQW
jgi:hypothetical protein